MKGSFQNHKIMSLEQSDSADALDLDATISLDGGDVSDDQGKLLSRALVCVLNFV